jgi:hypothetical protein
VEVGKGQQVLGFGVALGPVIRWGVLKEGLMTRAREILPGGGH